MSEKHLILGGGGFIGRHVSVLLARAGHSVVLADRNPPTFQFPPEVADQISWTLFELASADWTRLLLDASVIHLYAWTSIPATANANPAGDLAANVGATLNLLDALRQRPGKRLVFASSGGTVYGKLRQVPVAEDHSFGPVTAYGASKATAEIYMGLYGALHGVDCRIARISNPFGAGQDLARGQGAVTTFLAKALANEMIHIWGDGEIVRDYIHISDVAKALVLLAGAQLTETTSVFNIGSGQGTSLNGIIEAIRHHLNRPVNVTREPARSFDLPVSILDISKASELLGWRPQMSFSDAIAKSIGDLAAGEALSTLE